MKKILEYSFEFIGNIQPFIENGKIKDIHPQEKYCKKDLVQKNRYGDGAFCRFSISNKWLKISGVYALFSNDKLLYIGQCLDLTKRFNTGYGNISPRNCYIGGQSTNCRINKVIRSEILSGNDITLYFYAKQDFRTIEQELIQSYRPIHNINS